MSPNISDPARPRGTWATLHGLLEWSINLPAVLFNTGFAILAIVTLCGIVFVTRPHETMHGIPPGMWLPLLIVMAPAQIYAQVLSWSAIFAGRAPTGPAIALRQARMPRPMKFPVAMLWLLNFCIGLGIAIIVFTARPDRGEPPPPRAVASIALVIAFLFALAANIYLLLAIRTLTPNDNLLRRVWRIGFWIDVAMAVVAAVYHLH